MFLFILERIGDVIISFSSILKNRHYSGIYNISRNGKQIQGNLHLSYYYESSDIPHPLLLKPDLSKDGSRLVRFNQNQVKLSNSILVYAKCIGAIEDSSTYSIIIETTALISDIKNKIEHILNGRSVKHFLYAGKQLSDKLTLVQAGIQKECTIQCFISSQDSIEDKKGILNIFQAFYYLGPLEKMKLIRQASLKSQFGRLNSWYYL